MSQRKLMGAVVLVALIIFGAVTKSNHTDWDPLLSLGFILVICAAFVVAFYDKKNMPKKVWDFDPKRGLLYFCLGWVIFPIVIAVNAFSDANFSWSGMVIGTLIMSVLIGIAGTLMENVGV